MQGRNAYAFQLYDRMEGFVKKFRRLRERVGRKYFPCFHQWMSWEILALHGQFSNYFSEANSWRRDKTWIQFTFRDNAADGARLTVTEEDQLMELSTDSTFRNIYETIHKTFHNWKEKQG